MSKKNIKINSLKSNKNLILIIALLIVLVVVFSPKLIDLTGRIVDTAELTLVVQKVDGNPVGSGANVKLYRTGTPSVIREDNTGADSQVTFTGISITEEEYYFVVSKSGYKAYHGPDCTFVVDEDKTRTIRLQGGSGNFYCALLDNGECTTDRSTWRYVRSGTDQFYNRVRCTLKVYTDNTYSVSCLPQSAGQYAIHGKSPGGICQGETWNKNIEDIDDDVKYTAGTLVYAEEYVCVDGFTSSHTLPGFINERVKVKKQGDILTLSINSLWGERCSSGNNCGTQGSYNYYSTQTCTVNISEMQIITSTTPTCGNSQIDTGEECDGGTGCTNCICDTDYQSTDPISINCEIETTPVDCSTDPTICSNPTPVCDAGICVQCKDEEDAYCGALGKICDIDSTSSTYQECIPECATDQDCTNPNNPVCDAGNCVQCTSLNDDECSGNEVCYNNVCVVGCLAQEDCIRFYVDPDWQKINCDLSNRICVECLIDSHCAYFDPDTTTPVCSENTCVECSDNIDCASGEACDINSNTCVKTCTTVTDCLSGEICYNGICTPGCLSRRSCTNPTTPACHPDDHICVQCLVDSDCSIYPIKTKCNNNLCVEPTAACSPTEQKISTTEYCDASGTPQDVLSIGETCSQDYECTDNICSVGNKCLSYEALKEAVCTYVNPAGLSGNLLVSYNDLGC